MFAGDGTAHFDAEADDFVGGGDCAAKLFFFASIKKNDGMQVAVAGMENVSDLETIFCADLIDPPQGVRQLGPRDYSVLHVVGRGEPPNGAESVLSAFPKQGALMLVARHAHFASVMKAANIGDIFCMLIDSLAQAVHFEQQDGGAVDGKSCVHVSLDCANRPAIEHLASRGSDSARGDIDDGFCGIVHGIENCEQGFHCFRIARKLHGNFRD